jgi:hypothetical protein
MGVSRVSTNATMEFPRLNIDMWETAFLSAVQLGLERHPEILN